MTTPDLFLPFTRIAIEITWTSKLPHRFAWKLNCKTSKKINERYQPPLPISTMAPMGDPCPSQQWITWIRPSAYCFSSISDRIAEIEATMVASQEASPALPIQMPRLSGHLTTSLTQTEPTNTNSNRYHLIRAAMLASVKTAELAFITIKRPTSEPKSEKSTQNSESKIFLSS